WIDETKKFQVETGQSSAWYPAFNPSMGVTLAYSLFDGVIQPSFNLNWNSRFFFKPNELTGKDLQEGSATLSISIVNIAPGLSVTGFIGGSASKLFVDSKPVWKPNLIGGGVVTFGARYNFNMKRFELDN